MLQWGEDQDVKVRDDEERDFENEMDELNLNDWALLFALIWLKKPLRHNDTAR